MKIFVDFLLLALLILSSFACQRNNMPYGGDSEVKNPPYTQQPDINGTQK